MKSVGTKLAAWRRQHIYIHDRIWTQSAVSKWAGFQICIHPNWFGGRLHWLKRGQKSKSHGRRCIGASLWTQKMYRSKNWIRKKKHLCLFLFYYHWHPFINALISHLFDWCEADKFRVNHHHASILQYVVTLPLQITPRSHRICHVFIGITLTAFFKILWVMIQNLRIKSMTLTERLLGWFTTKLVNTKHKDYSSWYCWLQIAGS